MIKAKKIEWAKRRSSDRFDCPTWDGVVVDGCLITFRVMHHTLFDSSKNHFRADLIFDTIDFIRNDNPKTLEEAKQWCQEQLDNLANQIAEQA